jgi:hypothetical protein
MLTYYVVKNSDVNIFFGLFTEVAVLHKKKCKSTIIEAENNTFLSGESVSRSCAVCFQEYFFYFLFTGTHAENIWKC